MEDIAKHAGVSKSAVSIALSGKPGIGPETRERILQIAKDYGYAPKARSSSGRDQTPGSIAFLVFGGSGIVLEHYYKQPFFRELLHFIEEKCRTYSYSLLYASADYSSIEEDIRAFADAKRCDGVILLGTNLDAAQIAFIQEKLETPLVVLDTCFETLPVPFVQINNLMGAYQAGVHLCELGHRDIGYVASNSRMRNFDDRRQGFLAALGEREITVDADRVFSVAPAILSSQESLKKQLTDYVATGRPMPSALFCECDYIAISAIKSLIELGYNVPEDVSVVGFDNITEALIVSPELTTVHVEKERMAHLAVDMLVQAIESDEPVAVKTFVDTKFVPRLSSKKR